MASALMEFSNGLAEAVEHAGASVMAVLEGGRSGVSGVVWRNGLVVTSEHTIRGYDEVSVVLPSGAKAKAGIVGRDPGTDLALLKVPEATQAAPIADASHLRAGHLVMAVGRRPDHGLSASYGVVSATGGAWRTWHGGRVDQWLRLDLNPYPGFSGGPLIDLEGRVLGINTSGPRRSIMTIPSATVSRVLDQLQQHGRIVRGYLGVGVQPIAFPPDVQQGMGLKHGRGLLVITLAPDGPAHAAGMLLGDILVALEGNPVADASDLQAALDPEKVGHPVRMQVVRGGVVTELTVTIGERPRRQ